MLCKEVQDYISTVKGLPFFYIVGDEDYKTVLNELKQSGIFIIRMSDFCLREDKFPSVDDLIDYFRTSDIDYRKNKFAVIGLGEYLAIRGAAFLEKELKRLKNITLGNARAILLLRGITTQTKNLIRDDNKIIGQQRAYISETMLTNLSITTVPFGMDLSAYKGIKELLYALEDGVSGNILVSTNLSFDNSIFPVSIISSAYTVLKSAICDFNVDEYIGNEEQWLCLLKDYNECEKSLSDVFSKYNIDECIYDDLNNNISGFEYRNWLVFLYLKLGINNISNVYFQLVVRETKNYADLKNNLLLKIIEFSHTDSIFRRLYDDRKKLLKNFSEADISIFIKENEIDLNESIYRYTDNTRLEKIAVIRWIVANGMTDAIEYVYPALKLYLKKYIFDCSVLSTELTKYFDAYKQQKVSNYVSDDFMNLVEEHAIKLSYTKLPTRDNAIKAISGKKDAYLYWIDALGVEYLSYITALAEKKGLSIHTDIVRCDLPTITKINKSFYDDWSGGKKYKESRLDNIKHKDKGGYFYKKEEAPIHLPEELEIIEEAIDIAAKELGMHHCQSFVIASDHGASRLAVIRDQEVKYETDTKAEHSGRCCLCFDGCDLTYKVKDNGYIMLSDYGRFMGSRSANVEVHGGASLEEIIVPVITLTLKKMTGIKIEIMNPNEIIPDRHNGTSLMVYISNVVFSDHVRLIIDDNTYIGNSADGLHFTFELKNIKRARKEPYSAEIYDKFDLIGTIAFKTKSKMAREKDEFNLEF